jgi:hypothetical protein
MRLLAAPLLLTLTLLPPLTASASSGVDQVPQPFPKPSTPNGGGGSTSSSAPTRPATPPPPAPAPAPASAAQATTPPPAAASAAAQGAPTEDMLGAPIYKGAQFLASYDAGQGQRYYLFGTTSSFAEVVAYYRTALRQRGDLVFEEPATHMFEIGRFREESMAFPPGVTVKDYTWGNLKGYANPKLGAQPERFPTVIQMVPAGTP